MNTQTTIESSDSKINYSKIGLLIVIIGIIIAGFLLIPSESRLAAEVNGQSITKRDFDLKYNQTIEILKTFSGEELPEAQLSTVRTDVINELIAEVLVNEYAESNSISVSDEEVTEEYTLAAVNSGGEEELKSQLEQFNISESRFRADLKKNLILRKSLENYLPPGELLVDETEIRSTYDSLVEESQLNNADEEIPPYEEAKEFLATQIKNQKIQTHSVSFLEELKEEAEIEIFI